MKLDLSEAIYIPPEADEYVERILSSWQYELYCERNEKELDPSIEVLRSSAEKVLRERFPHLVGVVDKAVLNLLLNEARTRKTTL